MMRHVSVALLILSMPSTSAAQQGPERLLPGGSQVCFQFDGFEAHRAAFDQSAVGKMLKGDTGKFLSELASYLGQQVDGVVGLFDAQAAQIIKDTGTVLADLGRHGWS